MASYLYVVYGLHVASEIECPELCPASFSSIDINVRFGSVPEQIDNPTGCGVVYQTRPDTFLLNLARVARYLVRNGNEITIEPAPDADKDSIRLFLLGSCFGALLFQRGLLPLHGSAIASPKGAVIFAGASGHGKSTLAGAFHHQGYQVLSDDVAAITIKDGVPYVLPAYPRLMLWADAVERLGVTSSKLRPARAQLEKFHYRLDQPPLEHPLPLHAIYLLAPTNSNTITITPLSGFDKIQRLNDNTYRSQFLTGMKLASTHFRQIAAIAQYTKVARVTRPDNSYQLEELAALLQKDFLA